MSDKLSVKYDEPIVLTTKTDNENQNLIDFEYVIEEDKLKRVDITVDGDVIAKIPDGVTNLDYVCFGQGNPINLCDVVTTIIMPDSITDMANPDDSYGLNYGCLKDLDSLENVVFSKNLHYIGGAAFKDSFNKFKETSLIIPEHITTLGYGAFFGCGLTNIYIPKSITTIGEDCFDNSHIKNIYYEGTQEEWESLNVIIQGGSEKTIHYNSTPDMIN